MKTVATVAFLLLLVVGCSSETQQRSTATPAGKQAGIGPLANAIAQGDAEGVRTAIQAGADVNGIVGRDGRPLHVAVMLNRLEIAEILLNAGAEINATTDRGVTPLGTAVFMKQDKLALMLIHRRANTNLANASGTTPLIMAANNKLQAVGIALIDAGCDVHAVTKSHGTTALMMAAHHDLRHLATRLMMAGADPRLHDNHSMSSFDYAKTAEMKAILDNNKARE